MKRKLLYKLCVSPRLINKTVSKFLSGSNSVLFTVLVILVSNATVFSQNNDNRGDCLPAFIEEIIPLPALICPGSGNSSTLVIDGLLNHDTEWNLYSDSCDGTLLQTSTSNFFVVSPSVTTTYYIRGEGCTLPNNDQCVAVTVQIEPDTPPTVITQNIIVQLDTNGLAAITPSDVDNGSFDDCGIVSRTLDIDTFDCSNIGNNSVTLTVTDTDGLSSSDIANVLVENIFLAICQDLTVVLDANGQATITPQDIDNGSFDSCFEIVSMSLNQDTFDCSNIGLNSVTLNVINENLNERSCTAIVTVLDSTAPTITCPADITMANESGLCIANVTFADPQLSENCSSLPPNSISGFDRMGVFNGKTFFISSDAMTVAQAFSDAIANGGFVATITSAEENQFLNDYMTNNAIAVATIGYNDVDQEGTFVWQSGSTSTYTNWRPDEPNDFGSGEDYSEIRENDGGWNDVSGDTSNRYVLEFAGGFEQTRGLPSGSDFTVGVHIMEFTATDTNGNVSSCSFNITVQDTEPPVITCPSNIITPTDPGSCFANVTYNLPTVTDNCIIAPETIPGFITVGFSQGRTIYLSRTNNLESGAESFLAAELLDGHLATILNQEDYDFIFDNFPPLNTIGSRIYIGYSDVVEEGEFEWHSGSSSTYTNWRAGEPNNAGNEDYAVISTRTNSISDVRDWFDDAGTINRQYLLEISGSSIELVQGLPSGSNFPVGETIVEYQITDAGGNVSSCSFTVTVNDTEAPNFIFEDIITFTDPDVCGAVVNFENPLISDNCPIPMTFEGFQPIGTANGNSYYISDNQFTGAEAFAEAQLQGGFVATVLTSETNQIIADYLTANNIPNALIGYNDLATEGTFEWQNGDTPFFENWASGEPNDFGSGEDYTIMLNSGLWNDIPSDFTQPFIIELQSRATQTNGPVSGSFFPIGSTSIEFSATDENGNSTTETYSVTVQDVEPPVAICQDLTVTLDENGMASISAFDVDNGSTDNCGIDAIFLNKSDFDCSDIGTNNIVLSVTDVFGNTSTCISTVTVNDANGVSISCLSDMMVNNDPGICEASVVVLQPTVMDNCNLSKIAGPITNFNFGSDGTGNLMDTVTTISGLNTSIADVSVDIEINGDFDISLECFELHGPDGTIVFNECGLGDDVECSTENESFNITQSTWNNWIANFGTNLSFTLQADDDVNSGINGCTNFFQLTANISALPTLTNDFNGTDDASGIYPVGATIVTWTTTDLSGNSSSCTQMITVSDTEPPVALCQDITVQLDDVARNVTITANDIDNGSTDNCGIDTITISADNFTCADIGENTVVLTVTDNNGNISTCNAIITVEDQLEPVITCPSNQTHAFDTGNQFYTVPDYWATGEAITVDNCTDPVTILTQSPTPGTPLTIGTYTVTLTAEDESGNISTCTFELIVDDTLGVIDNTLEDLALYPNPATNEITLKNPNRIELTELLIYDITGKVIIKRDIDNTQIETTIDVSNFSSSIYIVEIRSEFNRTLRKLIKE